MCQQISRKTSQILLGKNLSISEIKLFKLCSLWWAVNHAFQAVKHCSNSHNFMPRSTEFYNLVYREPIFRPKTQLLMHWPLFAGGISFYQQNNHLHIFFFLDHVAVVFHKQISHCFKQFLREVQKTNKKSLKTDLISTAVNWKSHIPCSKQLIFIEIERVDTL